MFTPRPDVISLFDFAKSLSGGSHRSPDFKKIHSELIRVYLTDSDRQHSTSSTIGQQTITHDEARYYCDIAGVPIPKGLIEPISQVSLKEQLLRLTKDEATLRATLTELTRRIEEGFIAWPYSLEKPPYDLPGLLDETFAASMDCSSPQALTTANKLAETSARFLGLAEYIQELERQIREIREFGGSSHA